MPRYYLFSFLLVLFSTSFAFAEPYAKPDRYHFDKAHTQILFFVDHLGFSMSQGEFLKYDGHFTFNPTHPQNSEIHVIIETDSLDMDHEGWNKHLKNKDFFNVETYPTMMFKSTSIKAIEENVGILKGDLTLLGVTKPVELHVTYNKSGIHPYSKNYISGFSAHATLNREDWGMTYGLPGVGNEVMIRIEVEGVRQAKLNE